MRLSIAMQLPSLRPSFFTSRRESTRTRTESVVQRAQSAPEKAFEKWWGDWESKLHELAK